MASHIYHGPWVNWSQGLISGATVTLGERSGGLLTSFIATFVTLVSAQLWRILCFALHQLRSNPGPQDGLHHQQQAVFRNSATPGGAAWTFTSQCWHWRNKARLTFLRTFPWALFSLAYLVLFALAAIFSSDISKSPGSARLIIGDQCGYWVLNDTSGDALAAYSAKITNDTLVAASYARACYGGSYDPLQCGRYTASNLAWTGNQNASCPYKSGLCYYGDTAAYNMQTGRVNSHHDLGINAPKKYRMEYIKSTTCAPLHTANYSEIVNLTQADADLGYGQKGDGLVESYLGPIYDGDINSDIITNWTWSYNTHSTIDQIGWLATTYAAIAGNGGWIPIPALNQTPGDVSIAFISANSIRFNAPCDDPVFAAHDFYNNTAAGVPNFWLSDHYAGVIACTETHALCNPNNNECTPPLGAQQVLSYIQANPSHLNLNTFQYYAMERIISAAMYTSIYHQITTRLGGALRAQDTLNQLDQSALPNNQWMIEVGSWFDTGLARMQHLVQEFATGPSNVVAGAYVWLPNYQGLSLMCDSQMVNDSRDTMSFSILGMGILFGIGGLIMLTSLFIEKLVAFIQKKTHKGLYARSAWQVDGNLQLQRLLFQETGQGHWSKSSEDPVPTTENKERFIGIAGVHAGGYGAVEGGEGGNGSNGEESPGVERVPPQYFDRK